MQFLRDERFRQVAVGVLIIALILAVTLGIRAASALPGALGEFFETITGVLGTPVLLEISFATIGFLIVLALNHWRAQREGDEFVEMDVLDRKSQQSDGPSNLG
jgi:cytochrome bd-type quinol oxidase subunit 1